MEFRRFKSGQIIFKDGEPGNEMYVIMSGKVKAYKIINAERIDLGIIEKDSFFGEMGVFSEDKRQAYVEAIEDTEVLVLNKETLLERIRENPDFAFRIMTTMSLRIKDAHQVISRLEGIKKSLEMMYSTKH